MPDIIVKTLVGLIALLCSGLLIVGADIISILLMSILCTGGIALGIILPFAYLTGMLIMKIFKPKARQEMGIIAGGFHLGKSDFDPLKDYIQNAKQQQMPDKIIMENLQRNGWKLSEIEKVINNMGD